MSRRGRDLSVKCYRCGWVGKRVQGEEGFGPCPMCRGPLAKAPNLYDERRLERVQRELRGER